MYLLELPVADCWEDADAACCADVDVSCCFEADLMCDSDSGCDGGRESCSDVGGEVRLPGEARVELFGVLRAASGGMRQISFEISVTQCTEILSRISSRLTVTVDPPME